MWRKLDSVVPRSRDGDNTRITTFFTFFNFADLDAAL